MRVTLTQLFRSKWLHFFFQCWLINMDWYLNNCRRQEDKKTKLFQIYTLCDFNQCYWPYFIYIYIYIYIYIIFTALFVMEHHWKNLLAMWGLEPSSQISVNRHATHSTITRMMVELVACLLTDSSDAGTSPHVAKRGFLNDVPWQIML